LPFASTIITPFVVCAYPTIPTAPEPSAGLTFVKPPSGLPTYKTSPVTNDAVFTFARTPATTTLPIELLFSDVFNKPNTGFTEPDDHKSSV
jgi:hypothetical protein